MSKILATDDFQTQNWTITIEDLQSNYADLFIGFTDEAPVVEFQNLQFKYQLKLNNEILQQGSYPPPNVRYINSDQVYLVVERLNLTPETTYELYLWAENDGNSFEKTFEFTTPRPPQPMYNNREYLILPSTEVSKIDFTQVCETSADTLPFSVDSTKTFINWDGEAPAFVADLVDTEGPYTYIEILDILSTPEWTGSIEEV